MITPKQRERMAETLNIDWVRNALPSCWGPYGRHAAELYVGAMVMAARFDMYCVHGNKWVIGIGPPILHPTALDAVLCAVELIAEGGATKTTRRATLSSIDTDGYTVDLDPPPPAPLDVPETVTANTRGLARHDGPDTMQDAADDITPSTGALRLRVFSYIRESGAYGATCDQTEIALNGTHQGISPRFTELSRSGVIRDSGQRRKTRRNRRAIVWVTSKAGEDMSGLFTNGDEGTNP